MQLSTKGDLEGAQADYDKAIELQPDLVAARKNIDETVQAMTLAREADAIKAEPAEESTPVFRTDFSNEAAWNSICAVIQNPEQDFAVNVNFINAPQYNGLSTRQMATALSENPSLSFALVIDGRALAEPENPILVIDLQEEPGRSFRVIASALWEVENNLSIANMDFQDFLGATDQEGIYRGFQ